MTSAIIRINYSTYWSSCLSEFIHSINSFDGMILLSWSTFKALFLKFKFVVLYVAGLLVRPGLSNLDSIELYDNILSSRLSFAKPVASSTLRAVCESSGGLILV